MTDVRIGLLVCDHVSSEFYDIAGDYDEMFATMLDGRDVDLVAYDAVNGVLPERTDECLGYLITGSKSSVNDDEQWIRDLEQFIRDASEASVPIFGVCFGLHLFAKALGGSVERSEKGWGVGVHTMRVSEEREWMNPRSEFVSLAMSHKDQVVSLPDGARTLGSTDHCEHFLVEFAPGMVGVQGHPEFSARYVQTLYESRTEQLGALLLPAVASLQNPTDSSLVADWAVSVISKS